jgi:hypothetical protein
MHAKPARRPGAALVLLALLAGARVACAQPAAESDGFVTTPDGVRLYYRKAGS